MLQKDIPSFPSAWQVQPTLNYAIVDEADSILIDESRNPMLISVAAGLVEAAVLLIDKVSAVSMHVRRATLSLSHPS